MPLLFAEGMNGPRLRRDISVTGVVWSVTQRLGVSISRMPRFSLTLFGIEKKKTNQGIQSVTLRFKTCLCPQLYDFKQVT